MKILSVLNIWKRLRQTRSPFHKKSISEIRDALRPYYLSFDNISKIARQNWENGGRVPGNDEFNWQMAEWQLEALLETDAEIYWMFEQKKNFTT